MPASLRPAGRSSTIRCVDTTQRICQPLQRGVARERVTFLIGAVEQLVEVVRQERRFGGSQACCICGQCSSLRSHLFVVNGSILCRVCGKLSYRSRHVPRAVARATKLRRRLGGAPGLLAPLPRKPRHWSPVYYRRLIGELIAAEGVIREMLGGTIRALERRKGRLHGPK